MAVGKITELTVSRGRTRRPSNAEEWVREEYTLKAVIEDERELEAARAHMLGLIEGWLTAPAAPMPSKPPTRLFPQELEQLLIFEETTEYTVIRPRQYLGKENFARIAAIVKDQGGEYISAGKQSHFRISKKASN
jgi:hypothetical protein